MFVYNVKVSSGKLFKFVFAFIFIIILGITGFAIFKVFGVNSNLTEKNDIYNIDSNNYTNILKAVHEDLDTYIGQKISFSGYIYRTYDFQNNEFVLARDMIINSANETLVVGFLCKSDNASNFKDGTWVNITGEIKKGDYHGDIPIIEVSKIEETKKPNDALVYPPNDFYIPTSSLLYNNSY